MARKYVKKSQYWQNIVKGQSGQSSVAPPLANLIQESANYEPKIVGDSYYSSVAKASYSRSTSSNTTRYRGSSASHTLEMSEKYVNIRSGSLPFESEGDLWEVRDSIELCQKAYANVAIFRNAIDIMSEFSNAEIYLEGGSAKAKDFLQKWMKYVKIWNIKDQYFREFFRSGNVFFYKTKAKLELEDFLGLVKNFAAETTRVGEAAPLDSDLEKKNEIPIQYTLLNPYWVMAQRTNGWDRTCYMRMLSEYELERLRDAKNEHDKTVFNSLDAEIKDAIKRGNWNSSGITVKIDPANLIYSFYKKQDYEPFAVPFGFAVLDDIDFKLEMKKIDKAISKTIENVILLITMGNEPTKGGINAKNLQAMQTLLANPSSGRILVADYTTKGEWLIPDMNKILGYEKYKIVNEDIKEGLQNILIGSDKFANTQVKAQVFFERLKESRNAFINDFLQPELQQIFANMGFKGKCPIAKFEEVSIKDETQFNRVVTRLMELGVLPPEEGLKVIQTGIYPIPEDLVAAQQKFTEERKKGFYNPLVGGVPMVLPPADPNAPKTGAPITLPNKKESGRPLGSNTKASVYAKDAIQEVMTLSKDLYSIVEKSLKTKFEKKSLNKEQKVLVTNITESIIVGAKSDNWKEFATNFATDLNALAKLNVLPEINELAAEHNIPTYAAALLFHSSQIGQ